MTVALNQNTHLYSHVVESAQSIDKIESNAPELAFEFAKFLHESIKLAPPNSSYTVELKLRNDPSDKLVFELIFGEKGNKDQAMKSPDLVSEKTCDKCKTVFEHTYRCLDKSETELKKENRYRPSKTFGDVVEKDGMIAVISSKNVLLITPDPQKIDDYLEYTHLFELPIDRIQRIALPLFRVISYLNSEGIKPDQYTIKWNAGIPTNTVKIFHTRFEGLPERRCYTAI